MSLVVKAEQVAGRRVLFLAGSGGEALLIGVAKATASLVERDEIRVVNVDELLLADVNAIRAFLAHLADRDTAERLVLSCRRITGRRLLRLWGGDDLPIVSDTAEAVAHAYPDGVTLQVGGVTGDV